MVMQSLKLLLLLTLTFTLTSCNWWPFKPKYPLPAGKWEGREYLCKDLSDETFYPVRFEFYKDGETYFIQAGYVTGSGWTGNGGAWNCDGTGKYKYSQDNYYEISDMSRWTVTRKDKELIIKCKNVTWIIHPVKEFSPIDSRQ